MIRQLIKLRRRQILIDINTQKDYFLADGNSCIWNHRRVLANIRRIMAWARKRNINVISTCEVHDNNGNGRYNYCIDGTEGQKKVRYTLLNNQSCFSADNNSDLPADILWQYKQVILHERCADPFEEPRIERLLSEVRANEFIIIGATAEKAVKAAVLGLLQRGRRVTVVVDAVGTNDRNEAKLAFRKMQAKGAKLVEARKIAGTTRLRCVGVCDCPMCQGHTQKTTVKLGL